ncbi:hypothetical protein ACM61V_05405 [Sphingomonas sp. TX0543]|uniref:hypothetical protein n=1 Tax=Sphingomonas sp. TX0543 TaxID=3399682 RepID=UPI003AFA06E1
MESRTVFGRATLILALMAAPDGSGRLALSELHRRVPARVRPLATHGLCGGLPSGQVNGLSLSR